MKESQVERIKATYPRGTRIECLSMVDIQAIPSGTKGTVTNVDDIGTIHMRWDNGRSLGLVPDEDSFRIVKEEVK